MFFGQATFGSGLPAQEGVASSPAQRSDDETILRERVEGRWQALIARDFRAAYDFETPSYRAMNPFEKFHGRFGGAVIWHVVRVVEVRYDDPTVARVKVAVDYSAPTSWGDQAAKATTHISETWLKRDGQWWHSD